MSFLKYRASKYTSFTGFLAAAVVVLAVLLSAGCNQDGVGIYYAISQEEKQIDSRISELSVQQVVETNGTVYARTGGEIWEKAGDDSWRSIGGGTAWGGMVDYSDDLYAYFINDDLDNGVLKRWNGSSWSTSGFDQPPTNNDIDLFSMDGAYALEIDQLDGDGNRIHEIRTTNDFSTYHLQAFQDDVYDGTSLGATSFLISSSSIYSGTFDSLNKITTLSFSGQSVSGDYLSITSDGTTNLFLLTSSKQIFTSTDGENWNFVDDAIDKPVESSADIVTIDSNDFLIFGTETYAYNEMRIESTITDSEVSRPSITTNSTTDSFAANYPILSDSLGFQVYASSVPNEFYVATGPYSGLWKRTSTGEFQRQ